MRRKVEIMLTSALPRRLAEGARVEKQKRRGNENATGGKRRKGNVREWSSNKSKGYEKKLTGKITEWENVRKKREKKRGRENVTEEKWRKGNKREWTRNKSKLYERVNRQNNRENVRNKGRQEEQKR